ncbi:hypothetical protein L218DRAFT_998538 [Marasmius fiardii PR-910]|nr:hypothetical protein L218DRAFT_998538 [Marasmius fiardii PR-910]
MAFSSDADGSSVVLAPCEDATTFTAPYFGFTGPFRVSNGTICLDARDGNPSNGNPPQAWSCVEGNTNQLWTLDGQAPDTGAHSITWAGQDKCLQLNSDDYVVGEGVQLWDCNKSERRQWWNPM